MNEVVILIPIVNLPQNRTEEQLVLFMGMAVQQLIELGALKGSADDILKDYYVDDATNYINITIPQTALGLTNELEAVGAATCPTYKVADGMLQYIDAADGELKTFSAATINERLRIAMRNPKLRFRYTIMDYKKFYKQKESQLKKNPEMAQKLRNMFLTDVMGMFTEVLPQIEDGKQLATLVGTSQVTPKLNKVARELSMAYRKALKMEKASGQINKSNYSRLKKSYTQFMNELLEQVFPGLTQSNEQKEESRKYSYCKDGRIDLYAEPTTEHIEHDAENEVLDEETRALNEDLNHFEEESQKEYSELGENTYIVAKYEALNKDVDSYYYDLISELHPLFEKLTDLNKNQSIKDKEWKITKITDAVELGEALKSLKKQGVKSFSDGMTEVTFRTTNPEQLTKIVNAIGECGNGGHSFDIVIDPDLSEADGGNKKFGWDGDGGDSIEISDKTFSDNDDYYVVVHQNGVVDSWFGPYSHDESDKVEDEVANELESGFTVGIWSLDTLLNKLNKQRKGNYTAEQVNSHAEKRSFSDNSVIRKEAKRLFKIFDPKATDAEIEKLINFGLGLAADPQDLIDSLKDNLKKQGKTFSERLVIDEYSDEPRAEKYSVKYHVKDKSGKESAHKVVIHARDKHAAFDRVCNQLDIREHEGLISDYMVDEPLRLEPTLFSNREKVSAEMLEKAKTDGVVQKKPNGSWGIISIDAGEWWTPDYESKDKAENALEAYHANKFNE